MSIFNFSILQTLLDHLSTLKIVGGFRSVLKSARTDDFHHLFFFQLFLYDTTTLQTI